jgi:helix-turn-helix protein
LAEALAEQLGHPVSRQRIYEWEAGDREPGSVKLIAVAEVVSKKLGMQRGEAMAFLVQDPPGMRPGEEAAAQLPDTLPRRVRRRRAG